MSMLLGPSKEAAKDSAKRDAKKGSDSKKASKGEKPVAEAVPDHPQAVVPDHPQAIATTPEDLAEAEKSAEQDVSAK